MKHLTGFRRRDALCCCHAQTRTNNSMFVTAAFHHTHMQVYLDTKLLYTLAKLRPPFIQGGNLI